ncbi:hypothetical protein IOD16_20445 [Saccharothrix sp. 6-C]|uniref:hypothetical protein n=1 Tax=Saccharothrix sp. 6-C TaxID=2781735 RepID=UPI001916F574|nr:hypothetical protein [Saccharothrix sp. 6-C]QQQ73652.1 hypothetical protein IOD16_20445 [Saccharothrix sp. 6-C]
MPGRRAHALVLPQQCDRLTAELDQVATVQTADLRADDPEATRSLLSAAPARQATEAVTDTGTSPTQPGSRAVPDGARREILDAVQAVLPGSGASTSC